jgi:tetratricopeptide (TPR) repeat protein
MAQHNLAILLTRTASEDFRSGNADRAESKLKEALDLYANAAPLRPGHDKLHLNWSDALMMLGRWDEAIEHARIGLDNFIAFNELEVAAGKRVNEQRNVRTVARVHARMGDAYMQLGQPAEASNEYARAIQLDPGLIDALVGRAEALAAQERFDEALVLARAAAAMPPRAGDDAGPARGLLTTARLFDRMARDADAVEAYRAYLSRMPEDAPAHAALGVLLGRMERYGEAADAFGRALAIAPDFKLAREGLAAATVMHRKQSSIPATTRSAR